MALQKIRKIKDEHDGDDNTQIVITSCSNQYMMWALYEEKDFIDFYAISSEIIACFLYKIYDQQLGK